MNAAVIDLTPYSGPVNRSAQSILEGIARQIREGQYAIVHHPDRLSHASYDGDDFMQLVRSLPKGTVISGHSDNSL